MSQNIFCLRPLRKIIKKIVQNGNCCSFMSNNHSTNTLWHHRYEAEWRNMCERLLVCCLISKVTKKLSSLFHPFTLYIEDAQQKASINFTMWLNDVNAFSCRGVHFYIHAYLFFGIYTFSRGSFVVVRGRTFPVALFSVKKSFRIIFYLNKFFMLQLSIN